MIGTVVVVVEIVGCHGDWIEQGKVGTKIRYGLWFRMKSSWNEGSRYSSLSNCYSLWVILGYSSLDTRHEDS